MITLSKTEKVLAVVPTYASGPGWSNRLASVYIGDFATSKFRVEYLQPEEQSKGLHTLFDIGAAAHDALISAVETKVKK